LELSCPVAQELSIRKFNFELRRYVEDGKHVYTKKQRRAFQRLMSGLTVGKSRRERLRFMTLTSSPAKAIAILPPNIKNMLEASIGLSPKATLLLAAITTPFLWYAPIMQVTEITSPLYVGSL
jgi:hypothetical protein